MSKEYDNWGKAETGLLTFVASSLALVGGLLVNHNKKEKEEPKPKSQELFRVGSISVNKDVNKDE